MLFVVLNLALVLQRAGDAFMVPLLEAPSRMEAVQRQDGNNDHGPFEDDEVGLILDQFASPPLREFDDTIDAPNENAQCGDRESDEEALELDRSAQLGVVGGFQSVVGGPVRMSVSHRRHRKIRTDQDEDRQGRHLKRQPRNHDMIAGLG